MWGFDWNCSGAIPVCLKVSFREKKHSGFIDTEVIYFDPRRNLIESVKTPEIESPVERHQKENEVEIVSDKAMKSCWVWENQVDEFRKNCNGVVN